MVCFPNAKINIGLRITGKRPDGFHDLETVFMPVPTRDILEIIPAKDNELHFETSGLAINVTPEQNLCLRAFYLLQKDFLQVRPVKIYLHKIIPMGAGLGGGSADGAFALQLLNQLFNLQLTEDQLIAYALRLGSDCPFFIKNKPALAEGRGEILKEINLDLGKYFLLVVNPGIHIQTGSAFSQIKPEKPEKSLAVISSIDIESWKDWVFNDFEKAVFEQYPVIGDIKNTLYQRGAVYASMSGTGSTVYGIFANQPENMPFPSGYFQACYPL